MTRWVAKLKVRTRGDLVSWLLFLSLFAQAVAPTAATTLRTAGGAFSAGGGDTALAPAPSSAKKRTQLRAAGDDGGLRNYLEFDNPIALAAATRRQSRTVASAPSTWTSLPVVIRRAGLTPFSARAPPIF